MNKPHDHLFKSTFSDKRIAKDYIRNFLPTELTSKLDLNSLELSPTSHVNSDLEHGRGQWKKRTFRSHFRGLDDTLRPFIPEFAYLNTHMQDWTDKALMTLQAGLARNVMLLLKHYRDEAYTVQYIERLFIDIEQHWEDSTQKPHIKKFWVYLFDTNELKDEEFRKLFDRLPTYIKKEAMTTYQQIIQKGKIE
ncbi:MAG: Rpn family recombination-promoting nuclease/putative transposase, partial [Bacteroidota bacterium]